MTATEREALVKALRAIWSAHDNGTAQLLCIKAADMIEALSPERDAVLEEAAQIAENACLVPPDGGSPTDAETAVADEAAKRIRALKSPTPQTGSRK